MHCNCINGCASGLGVLQENKTMKTYNQALVICTIICSVLSLSLSGKARNAVAITGLGTGSVYCLLNHSSNKKDILSKDSIQKETYELIYTKESLEEEIKELKVLSEDIVKEADSKAIYVAKTIESKAIEKANALIKNAQDSLQEIYLTPIRNAHEEALRELNNQKLAAQQELERVCKIAMATQSEIERLKTTAQQEHQETRQSLIDEANQLAIERIQKMQEFVIDLESEIHNLTSENDLLKQELEDSSKSIYPPGWSFAETYAHGLIRLYEEIGIKLEYKVSLRERNDLIIRVVPRNLKTGEKNLRSYSDRVQRIMQLEDLPEITTIAGTIQFRLVPLEMRTLSGEFEREIKNSSDYAPPVTIPAQILTSAHPELTVQEQQEVLERSLLQNFVKPQYRYLPHEPLCQGERNWVLHLWLIAQITDQNVVINQVWKNTQGRGVSPGAGKCYAAAKRKLHQILTDAGIDFMQRKRTDYSE